jgi:hypothetical protein
LPGDLSRQAQSNFFLAVNRVDLRVGISSGLLAATATAGALVAMGSRAATVARPFNMIAGHVLGSYRSDVFGFLPGVTIVGVALHVFLVCLAGVAVAAVARRRFAPAWAAALALSLLSALVSIGIARRGGSSLARVLPIGDLILFYLLLAATLTVGVRIGFFERATGHTADRM